MALHRIRVCFALQALTFHFSCLWDPIAIARQPCDGLLPMAAMNELCKGGVERVHDGLELGVEVVDIRGHHAGAVDRAHGYRVEVPLMAVGGYGQGNTANCGGKFLGGKDKAFGNRVHDNTGGGEGEGTGDRKLPQFIGSAVFERRIP